MLETICWLLPVLRFKNRLLRRFGHDIADSAAIGPTLVRGVKRFEIGDAVEIGMFNALRGLSTVRLDEGASIGSWNWISAHQAYQEVDPQAGTLFIGAHAKIGSRSYVDCSGTFVIRPYGSLGGNRCLVQTHQPDFVEDRQSAGRITIGHHSMVGSAAVMLRGSSLPDQSLLAANSTMIERSSRNGRRGVYGGSPAVWKRDTPGRWFDRTAHAMTEHVVDGPMGALPGDATLGLRPSPALDGEQDDPPAARLYGS